MSGLPERPMPIRSTATHRAPVTNPASTPRHRNDEVGLPCRNNSVRPLPPATNAMLDPRTSTSSKAIPTGGHIASTVTNLAPRSAGVLACGQDRLRVPRAVAGWPSRLHLLAMAWLFSAASMRVMVTGRGIRWCAAVSAVLAGVMVVPGTAVADPRPYRDFDLQAHRGGLGLRSESTLSSFGNGIRLGVSTLELDIQITEDGQAVVTHDRRVDGTKCSDTAPATPDDPEFPYVGKFVNTLTLAQVKTLDCGSKTLPDFPEQVAAPGQRM